MTTNKTNLSDTKCAPHIKFDGISCIKLDMLIEMASAYNKSVKKEIIKLSKNKETLNPVKYKEYLIKEFNRHIGDTCSTQECWTKQDFIKHLQNPSQGEISKYTFRPQGPEGKFEWLNTYNINDVMKQYEKKHKDFKYLGTVPLDFESIPLYGINNFNVKELYNKGIKSIGLVINFDKSGGSGSHWVGLYAHFEKGVYYFDSYGTRPKPLIRSFMRKIFKQSKYWFSDKKIIASYNKIRHQYKNSECGVYSMNFIIRMLEGEKFESICESRTSDDEIHKYRQKYFLN